MTLQVKNGGFSYGGKRVLSGINFSVVSGDVFAVLGRNGAGKTTLLRCVMNFLCWQEGSAMLDGREIRYIPQKKLWREIAYVPQLRRVTDCLVREMVVLGRSAHIGVFETPKQSDYSIADEVMERLDISHLADESCTRISGGELQLVLIARALAAQPKLLILDEPESNLDYHNQLHVLNLIKEISHNTACILNTHYPEHALRFANKSLLLKKDGQGIAGATADVVTPDNLREAFNIEVHIGEAMIYNIIYKYIIPLTRQ